MKYYCFNENFIFSRNYIEDIEEISEEQFLNSNKDKYYYHYLMDLEKSKNGFIIKDFSDLFPEEEKIEDLFIENNFENLYLEIPEGIKSIIDKKLIIGLNGNYKNWKNLIGKRRKEKKRVNILGLGDVGSTLITGLKLLGGNIISEIGIYDLTADRINRWEMELNQVIDPSGKTFPRIKKISFDEIFDCDMFIFCASKYVPEVGSEVKDVRMAQFEGNSEIIKIYGSEARKRKFKGIFAVVSDPVDLLCTYLYNESNKNEENVFDYKGLEPNQIKGYGLGVMYGRASYYANNNHIDFTNGRAFGPHGRDLIIANNVFNYDCSISDKLTELTINANLQVRALGFKPYVAPALSSGAISIINTLEGTWNFSTVFINGVYFGCKNRMIEGITDIEKIPFNDKLYNKILLTYRELVKFWN